MAYSGQGVWGLKGSLASTLGLGKEDVHVTTPDVGGGFGMKAFDYPEYFMVGHAAHALGKPVRWQAERTESMLSDNSGRDLHSVVELAFDTDLKITAYRVDTLSNMGAYNSGFAQFIQSDLASRVLAGVYDIQTAWFRNAGIYTNTTQVDAYRGAGRPEAIYKLERAMDHAARELGVDPLELRRRNFVGKDQFPYTTVTNETYDVGDFDMVLASAEAHADMAGFAARKKASEAVGKRRGLGVCYYIESILGDPDETAKVEGTAIRATSEAIIDRFKPFVADQLGVPEVAFEDGTFRAEGSNVVMTLIEAADRAAEAGESDLLSTSQTTTLPGRSFPNGCHVAEVEVDPETGQTQVAKFTVVDDFGVLMNPMLAEGQVHGGVVQGIGQAISEHVVYDEDGQLLTATFMDYGMPRAADVPMIEFHTECVPSTANVLGMKGCGEAGTVGALAAVSNAVLDALWDDGVRHVDMPPMTQTTTNQTTFQDRIGRIAKTPDAAPLPASEGPVTPTRVTPPAISARDSAGRSRGWSIFLAVFLGLRAGHHRHGARVPPHAAQHCGAGNADRLRRGLRDVCDAHSVTCDPRTQPQTFAPAQADTACRLA